MEATHQGLVLQEVVDHIAQVEAQEDRQVLVRAVAEDNPYIKI